MNYAKRTQFKTCLSCFFQLENFALIAKSRGKFLLSESLVFLVSCILMDNNNSLALPSFGFLCSTFAFASFSFAFLFSFSHFSKQRRCK